MNECLFCRIVSGDLPSHMVYEDDRVVVFKDIAAKAPVHLLIVPRKHIRDVESASKADEGLVGHMFLTAARVAEEAGVKAGGYRLVVNNGVDAGQVVFHLHLHLLGGKRLAGMG